MTAICLHSQDEIAAVLRRSPYLHLYAIGDLDDFFWPYTLWYGLPDHSEIVMLYTAFDTPILHATSENPAAMSELLHAILHLLPRKIYCHLTSGLLDVMCNTYTVEEHGLHSKMALLHPDQCEKVDTSAVIPVTAADADELQTLYQVSNPDAWFDARMLETGCYYGIRQEKQLVSVAGVHVCSRTYRAAALGNVVTHPDYRSRGFARATCAKLCQSLRGKVDTIGLNVLNANAAAIHLYQQLGFETVGAYGEYMLELKR